MKKRKIKEIKALPNGEELLAKMAQEQIEINKEKERKVRLKKELKAESNAKKKIYELQHKKFKLQNKNDEYQMDHK